jgi:hypothetical protein
MMREQFASATLYRSLLPVVRHELPELAFDETHVFVKL